MIKNINKTRKWIDIFHSYTPEKRSEIIEKIKKKYNSKEYSQRTMRRGLIESEEKLLWVLLEYGKIYGKGLKQSTYDFCAERWLIDGTWIIKRYAFQDSFVTVETKEVEAVELEKLINWKKEYYEKMDNNSPNFRNS